MSPPLMPDVPLTARIMPADPSKPLILLIDAYTPTAEIAPTPPFTAESAAPAPGVARYSGGKFVGLSVGLMLVALSILAMARFRPGAG